MTTQTRPSGLLQRLAQFVAVLRLQAVEGVHGEVLFQPFTQIGGQAFVQYDRRLHHELQLGQRGHGAPRLG